METRERLLSCECLVSVPRNGCCLVSVLGLGWGWDWGRVRGAGGETARGGRQVEAAIRVKERWETRRVLRQDPLHQVGRAP